MALPRPLSNRSRRGLAALASTALILTTAYCGGSAFEAAPPGGSGPDGEAIDAAVADAADASIDAPTGDALTLDSAPADSGIQEASSGDASVIDAVAPPDAGAVSCSSPPSGTLFCADFDHVTSPEQTWTLPVAYGGGTNALDTVVFASPPNGYAAVIPKITAAAGASLTNNTLTSGATRIDFSFSANVKQIDTVDEATITAARLAVGTGGGHDLLLDLLIDKKGLRLQQSASAADGGQVTQESTIVSSVNLGTWVRIRLELDRGLTPAVRVFIDDIKKLDVPPVTTKITGLNVEVDLGMIFVVSPSTAAAITYDDVLVRGLL